MHSYDPGTRWGDSDRSKSTSSKASSVKYERMSNGDVGYAASGGGGGGSRSYSTSAAAAAMVNGSSTLLPLHLDSR